MNQERRKGGTWQLRFVKLDGIAEREACCLEYICLCIKVVPREENDVNGVTNLGSRFRLICFELGQSL